MRIPRPVRYASALVLAMLMHVPPASAEPPAWSAPPATMPASSDEIIVRDGFIPIRYDTESGRLFFEVRDLGREFLYMNTLATGLGAQGSGLDRGQVGDEALVRFERHGPRILLVRLNTTHRAMTDNPALIASVEESFPTSVIAAFSIERREGEAFVVDATEFLLGDVYDVRGRLRRSGSGDVRLERSRSYIDMDRSNAFPRNTEVRVSLTFMTDNPSAVLQRHAPDGRAVTLQQHHSFVALPETPMQTRRFDPRAGNFSVAFFDFARGFDERYQDRYTVRWRLEKRDPSSPISEPVQPIIYYLDPAVPEPYRTAFIEGGMWWNEIFEAAGFRNAFLIRDLPDGVDPMDARYNVIYWVHRTAPGPSVGPSYRDPRTGEILKTVIRMDSHRSLVNYDIYAGLRPALQAVLGEDAATVSAEAMAMARRRQHTAHEIGHTLGLAHNFIAAAQGRSSVMDYPYPLIGLGSDGALDLSALYREGGGAHDTLAIRFAYTQFETPAAEAAGLDAIIQDALRRGQRFITGGDASAAGSIPAATQWIEGDDMFSALERTTAVRDVLIRNFDESALDPGDPYALLNERFAHVYLHHRYALQGVIKTVGGMEYDYALRGDGRPATRILPAAEQRAALDRVLAALEPAALAVPERVAALIAPTAYGFSGAERLIPSPAGPAFDPLSLAGGLAREIVDGVLHPQRAARLVSFHARNPENPSLDQVVTRLVQATWGAPAASASGHAALRRIVQRAVLDGLMDLAADGRATTDVRAVAEYHLVRLVERIGAAGAAEGEEAAHRALARRDIAYYLEHRAPPPNRSRPPVVPLPWP